MMPPDSVYHWVTHIRRVGGRFIRKLESKIYCELSELFDNIFRVTLSKYISENIGFEAEIEVRYPEDFSGN